MPYLNHPAVADAPFTDQPPTVNGVIAPGEYAGAGKVTFTGYGGYYDEVEAFFAQDGVTLYVAFDSPDTTPYPYHSDGGTGPAFQVFLDITPTQVYTLPQPGDYLLTIRKDGKRLENQGDGSEWRGPATGQWIAAVHTTPWGWQGEFAIAFSKLGIKPGTFKEIGLALAEVWTPAWPHDWYWPASGYYLNPSTWGSLTSSSDWGSFYWKPGPWEDYAPSGLPDFDQTQNPAWALGPAWTHCGPVAAADSLWGFDSKFESLTGTSPAAAITDSYRLVTSYNASGWDDHAPANVIPLVDDLAMAYFGTNQGLQGTNVISMFYGIHRYLRDRGLWDDYLVTLVKKPTYQWVVDEVTRSEDVILLLGFWQEQPPGSGNWVRLGGHYVTVPGVDKQGGLVAFSDPSYNGADYNWPHAYPAGQPTVMGRSADGRMVIHPPYRNHAATVHNDAGNVSHDVYYVAPTGSPGGVWGPWKYVEGGWSSVEPFWGQNGTVGYPTPTGAPIQAEVDWAIAVSPVADLWVGKSAAPGTAAPGETVTFTIQFGNYGSLPAEGVVLNDTLPAGLVNPAFAGYWTSNGLAVTRRAGTTFTWDLPDLAWMAWGVITVTARVDPAYPWPAQTTLSNVAEIGSDSLEQYQVTPYVAPIPNVATATVTISNPKVYLPLALHSY